MTHRIEPASGRGSAADVSANRRVSDVVFVAATPAVIIASAALVVMSLVLTVSVITGVAHVLPSGVRAAMVCLVAVTLPGLPVAALLRLPRNGIFASVAIAVSIATNILAAQLNFGSGMRQPFAFQLLLLVITCAAIGLLARQWHSQAGGRSLLSAIASIRIRYSPTRTQWITLALLAVSVGLFISAVVRLNTSGAGSMGIIHILGLDYFLGLGLLGSVLAVEYCRSRIDRPMIAIANVVLITYVTMAVAWADGTAPFNTAYTHVFITDWMLDLGTLPPPVDARISWAGFFSAAAQLTTVGGLAGSEVFAVSASLVFGILLIYPVYSIGLTISGNPKAAWLGVTVYVLFNWYQQDYFAPQAEAMQIYATLIAVLLWQLGSANVPALSGGPVKRFATAWMRVPGRAEERSARWILTMEMVLLLLIVAQVVSHQLTPVATIAMLILFAALGVTRYKMLWLAVVLVFVAWFTYGADAFWEGHLGEIITDIGGVDQNLTAGVSGPVSSDPIYSRMQYLRIAASLLLFGAAAVGWLKVPRRAFRPILLALAIAPFGIILVQSYGGEVAIRCFLYASPILAPLAALILLNLVDLPGGDLRRHWPRIVAAALAFCALAVWVVTNRGLNTSFEHTTEEDVAVSGQLMDQTDPARIAFWGQGATLGLSQPKELAPGCFTSSQALADCTANEDILYFVKSDQDDKFLQYQEGFEPDDIQRAFDILLSEKGFEMMYDGAGVTVLKRTDAPTLDLVVNP